MMNDESLDALIARVKAKCRSWLAEDEHGFETVVDPLEGRPIVSHYAISHLCAALLLDSGEQDPDFELGTRLLAGLLARWGHDSQAVDFHHDFNNFALCVIAKRLEGLPRYEELAMRARATVLQTADSKHMTVNWLPMRVYANLNRLNWTGQAKYGRRVERLNRLMRAAQNGDGLIEDRLPRGRSFSLQYGVASVAGLEFLNRQAATRYSVDTMLPPLVTACDPVGDINYLGRGCNQVFAWGPWLYLLRATGQRALFSRSLEYLSNRAPQMIANDNLLLNDLPGADRDFWWDYHYCSVYLSHLLLWLVMTRQLEADGGSREFDQSCELAGQAGLKIVRSETAFVATFAGRQEYLAERGPMVVNIWTAAHGTLAKGTLGPWRGSFGTRYASACVPLNYFGLLELGSGRHAGASPVFAPVSAVVDSDGLILVYGPLAERAAVMNLPIHNRAAIEGIRVFAGGEQVPLRQGGRIRGPYGEVHLFQSLPATASSWRVVIPL